MKNFGKIRLSDLVKYLAILAFQLIWFGVVLVLNDVVYFELDVLGSWIVIGIVGVIVNLFLGILLEGIKNVLKERREHEVRFDDAPNVLTMDKLESMCK